MGLSTLFEGGKEKYIDLSHVRIHNAIACLVAVVNFEV